MRACHDELTYDAQFIRRNRVRLIRCGQAIAGFHALSRVDDSQLELDALFVSEKHQGKGFGRLLMADALKLARQQAAETLLIQADPYAEPFYLACGAVRIGERPSASIPGRNLPLLVLAVPS